SRWSGASSASDLTYLIFASLAERDAALKIHNQPPLGDWRGASKAKVTSRKFVNASRTVLDKFGRFKSESMSCDDKWHAAIPQCASAGLNISANLDPPSHSLFVLPPLVPKSRFELPLFAPHHKPHERPMDDSEYNAAQGTKDQRSAQEDKDVTTEIKGISRKAVFLIGHSHPDRPRPARRHHRTLRLRPPSRIHRGDSNYSGKRTRTRILARCRARCDLQPAVSALSHYHGGSSSSGRACGLFGLRRAGPMAAHPGDLVRAKPHLGKHAPHRTGPFPCQRDRRNPASTHLSAIGGRPETANVWSERRE